jgi:hypothetical protein
MNADLIFDLLADAFKDTIYLVPFLLVTYLLLEMLEHKANGKTEQLVQKAGRLGPAVAAVLGAIPQCGFSAAGSALFASRAITLGTLFAVFLSTSDEMLPLFIASQVNPGVMAAILGCKVAIGMIMGFAVDGVLRLRLHAAQAHAEEEHAHAHEQSCHCDHEHTEGAPAFGDEHCHNPSCHCAEEGTTWHSVVLGAVWHTLQVTVIVFLISLVLGGIMEGFGKEAVEGFLTGNPGLAVFVSALVGLIPNCGASVVITQLYLDGMLGTGAMMAGLLVSAGVGLLVLFSENHRVKQNLLILAGLYATGVCWGFAFQAAGIAFM